MSTAKAGRGKAFALAAAALACLAAACGVGAAPTGWPLEILGWNLAKAYPGIAYEWRPGIKGGVFPYTFTLAAGPSGMTVDSRKGIIRWTPPATQSTGNAVQVRVVDQAGATINVGYSIDVTTSGFCFVASDGNDGHAGTIDQPWLTLAKAQAAAGASDIVYVRAGTYTASALDMQGSTVSRWVAYPGESVVWDCAGSTIGVHKDSCAFVGLEIHNSGIHMFSLDGTVRSVIWRKNVMHAISAGSSKENPAFIFGMDGTARPIQGTIQYDKFLVQENTFYDITSSTNHAASVTCYNVKNLLYENNEAYQIASRGVSDKDDGYYNTIRANVLHDCGTGVGLYSQYTQGQIEVCYNLIYNCPSGITVGSQPGYIQNVFIHHNTIVGGDIDFGVITDSSACTNFNIYNNIIVNESTYLYGLPAVSTGSGYRLPHWCTNVASAAVQIDSNLLWTTGSYVAGLDWGIPKQSLADWRAKGFDIHSVLANPNLTASYALPSGSPYAGVYGCDLSELTGTCPPSRDPRLQNPNATGGSRTAGDLGAGIYDLQGRRVRPGAGSAVPMGCAVYLTVDLRNSAHIPQEHVTLE
jgi:hypothetical protein